MIVYHVSFWWTRSLQTGYGSVASFFQFSHTGLSCEIYICCLLWDYTYLSGLTLREVIKGKRQGASEKVITNLWVYRLQSFVSKPLCWEILIWPGHFLCRNDRSWITFFFLAGSYAHTGKPSYTTLVLLWWFCASFLLVTINQDQFEGSQVDEKEMRKHF